MARTSASSAPLTVVLLVVTALLMGQPAVASPRACSPSEIFSGRCDDRVSGGVDGGSVVLTGSETTPGQMGNGTRGSNGKGWSFTPGWARCHIAAPESPESCTPTTTTPRATGIPTITITDIATFVPTPGRQQMEPDGWTIAGLDTNFYAITGQHVVNGTLLGRPADVRFTPTTYLWAYGDGTRATKNTAGGTWAALGIPEFEPTPTSHVYDQVGEYTITLSIVFSAEYRFAGGPWRPVVGTITLPANDLHIRAGTAKTVLVEHDCAQNPAGPGC